VIYINNWKKYNKKLLTKKIIIILNIMGVPKFYGTWIKKQNFLNSILSKLPLNIYSLSIDFNSLIHEAAQFIYGYGEYDNINRRRFIITQSKEQTEMELFIKITELLSRIINKTSPIEYIIISIDGVVPLAKMNQQRNRRYLSKLSKYGITTEELIDIPILFDSSQISPGTEFMFRLDYYLKNWITQNLTILSNNVIYSSHMEPGEGEHKILDIFKKTENLKYAPSGSTHVIYGLDTDLIMLSLTLNISGLYLWKDTNYGNDVLYIDAFKFELGKKYQTKTAISDFILIISLLGNDFLPHHPTLNDYERSINDIMNIYIKLSLELTIINNNIYWFYI
jgi:5'-3' exoribonuclease 1